MIISTYTYTPVAMSKTQKSTKTVQNFNIREIKPNFVVPFNTDAHKKALQQLLTDRQESVVEFDLIDVSDKQANAIRRTLIDELDVMALDFDPQTLMTRYEFILRDEIRDRIRFIPISQDLPDNSEFSLDVLNNDPKVGIRTVYSGDIKGANAAGIPKKIRIAELPPGGYLKIPKITVVTGRGRQDSMFSLTSDINYDNLDFMDVHCVNKKANILTRRVSVDDMKKLMIKLGYKNPDPWGKKILIIWSQYDKLLTDRDRKRIELANYDNKLIVKEESMMPAAQSSSVASSNQFRIRAYLLGNIKPETVLPKVCDNLIARLKIVKSGITAIKKDGTDPDGIVDVSTRLVVSRNEDTETNQTLTIIRIRGETHTIGEMLVKHIYLLDTGIMNIKKRMNHPSENQVFIDIIHPNALKITLDAIDECINTFEKIKKESS